MQLRAKMGLLAVVAGLVTGCTLEENGLERLDQLFPPPDAGTTAGPDGGVNFDGGENPACVLPNDKDAGTVSVDGVDAGACSGTQGLWAARLVQFGTFSPLPDTPWNITATDLFLVSPSSDGKTFDLTFCGEDNAITDPMTGDPITLGQTVVPPETVAALAAIPVAVPLSGTNVSTGNVVWLWGLQSMADAGFDPLPTTADGGSEWTVLDQNDTGEPGATIDVENPDGTLYIVKRSIWNFEETKLAQGWITGPLKFSTEQNDLAASSSTLATPAPISPRNECTSLYQMVCITPEFTCDSLVQNYQTLFVNAP